MPSHTLRTFGRLFAMAVALTTSLCAGIASAAEPPDAGPVSLVITYQATPANRSALRHEMEQSTANELERLRRERRISQYNVLFNRYADSENWDAMVLLTFATPDDLYRWREVERTHPAALSEKAVALTTSIQTTVVDTKRMRALDTKLPHAVYVVIPYKTLVSPDEYEKYADGYVIPQFQGWMEEGVLSGYSLYTSRFPAGRPWNAMVVLQYKDETALSAREAVVTKVRERLKSNAEWKAISDSKKSVRTEQQVVVADRIGTHQ